jgi:hypothetical protein
MLVFVALVVMAQDEKQRWSNAPVAIFINEITIN